MRNPRGQSFGPVIPKGFVLGEFVNYQDAAKLVDRLVNADFTPAKISIIGSDLKLVERVRARLGYGRVAFSGAMTGFWLGLLFALLIGAGIEVTPEGGINYLPDQFFSVLVIGAGIGMLISIVRFALAKNKRSFISSQMPVAQRYEVIVPEADAVQAQQILSAGTSN
ncbi:MAG: hypothetical protein RIS51_145 [Actinomycetota bacterium]|jgi:hypothetical protein